MKIGLEICYIPQKKAKIVQKLISYPKSMIFTPKQDKKENSLIFDLKMRQIRYICPKITQNFHYQIKNLTPLGSVKVFN